MELLLAVVFTIIITRPCARLGAEDRKKIKGHSFKGIKAWHEAYMSAVRITIILRK